MRRSRMMFRTLSDFTTVAQCQLEFVCLWVQRTFVLADVLKGVGAAIVFPLHDADFAKGTFAYDPEETKVVEVYCSREAVSNAQTVDLSTDGRTLIGKNYRLALLIAHVRGV